MAGITAETAEEADTVAAAIQDAINSKLKKRIFKNMVRRYPLFFSQNTRTYEVVFYREY
jgi:hypothetical protein